MPDDPGRTGAGSLWIDTSVTPAILQVRDADDAGWLPVGAGQGGPAQFLHIQHDPLADWTIVHGLHRRPVVVVIDSAGTEVFGSVAYANADTVVVSFSAPFAGTALLT